MKNYTFDGNISREVLENYLSRAVTAAGLYDSKTLEDDLRAIRDLGVKFLGRASGIWYMMEDDEEHFQKSAALADMVHRMDPEIILQSCIFEWIVERMEDVKIRHMCLRLSDSPRRTEIFPCRRRFLRVRRISEAPEMTEERTAACRI